MLSFEAESILVSEVQGLQLGEAEWGMVLRQKGGLLLTVIVEGQPGERVA